MTFSDITLDQLRVANKAQILTFINNKLSALTKLQLCRLLLRVGDVDVDSLLEIPDPETGADCLHGPLWRLQPVRDIMGNKLRSTRFDWTYYPPSADGKCRVDTITTTKMDAADKVISTDMNKHFQDRNKVVEG